MIPSIDAAFKQFESMPYGYRAMIKLLQNYSKVNKCRTIRTMVSRWAPPSENDTQSYIATVRTLTGMDVDRTVNVDDKATMCSLAAAMSQVENGKRAVMADVEAGWELL